MLLEARSSPAVLPGRWQIGAALEVFAPRDPIRTLDWALEFGVRDDGQPYDDFAYPHLGAPGGPLDAIDCRGTSKSGCSGARGWANRSPARSGR
jgi:hypothetical protein